MLKEIPWGNLDHATGIGGMVIRWALPNGINLSLSQVPDDQRWINLGSWSAITTVHEDTGLPAPTVSYSIVPSTNSNLYSVTGNWLNYVGTNMVPPGIWSVVISINVVDSSGGEYNFAFTLGFTRVPKPPTMVWIENPSHPDLQTPAAGPGDKYLGTIIITDTNFTDSQLLETHSVGFVPGPTDRDNGILTWTQPNNWSGAITLPGPVAECLGQFDYKFSFRITDSDGLFVNLDISGDFKGPVDISITPVNPIHLATKNSSVANVCSLATNMGLAGSGTLTYTLNAGG